MPVDRIDVDGAGPGDLAPPPRRSRARRRRVAGGRPHEITVSLSGDELALVQAHAAAAGLSVGAYLGAAGAYARDGLNVAGMSAEERRGWAAELMAVRRYLAAVGNNLNQLARAANAGSAVDRGAAAATVEACRRAVARTDGVLDQLHGGRT